MSGCRVLGRICALLALAGGISLAGEDREQIVCAFETQTEVNWWMPTSSRGLSRRHYSQGRNSLEWTLRSDDDNVLSAERLRGRRTTGPYMDFSGADELAMDVYSPEKKLVGLKIRLADKSAGMDDETKSFVETFRLCPGKNSVRVGLDVLKSVDGSRQIEPKELILVEFMAERPRTKGTLYLDNLRLVTYGDTPEDASAKSVKRFDFGPPESTRWRGFFRVSKGAAYAGETGWGWSEAPQSGFMGTPPDDLAGDAAVCGKAKFRCDLADGKYKLWLLRAPSPDPTKSWSVSMGGKRILGEEIDSESFLSAKHLFRFREVDITGKTDVYEEYFGRSHPSDLVEIEVGGGAAELAFENVAAAALVLAPAEGAAELDGYLKGLAEARKASFEAEAYYREAMPVLQSEVSSTRVDQLRGYILFKRSMSDEMYPNSLPRQWEIGNKVELETAQGAPVTAVFGLVPLNEVEVKTTPGVIATGREALGVDAITFRRLRFLPKIVSPGVYTVAPAYLEIVDKLSLQKNRTEFLWMTIDPGEAGPGKYRGTVILSSGETASIDIELTVHPFKLPEKPTSSFGVFYRMPGITDANYRLGAFPDKVGDAEKKLAAELKDLADRGFSSVMLPEVRITKLAADKKSVELDTSELDAFAKAAKEVGVGRRAENIVPFYHVPERLKALGAGSSFLFSACYKDAMTKMRDWVEERGFAGVFWIYNPVAKGVAPASEHFEKSLVCFDYARGIPGVRTLAFIPSDAAVKGDLELLLPRADVVMTEPYDTSRRALHSAKARDIQDLWLSGSDAVRFTFGFQAWGMRATGRWHYAYQDWDTPYNPFAGGGGLVHPSKDGPVTSMDYERVTAGLADLRYVEVLQNTIARARESEATAAHGDSAEAALAKLRARIPKSVGTARGGRSYLQDLPRKAGEWRHTIISQIVALKQALGEIAPAEPVEPTNGKPPGVKEPPKDFLGMVREKLPPGWDPVHFLIIVGLGVLLLMVLFWVLLRAVRDRKPSSE